MEDLKEMYFYLEDEPYYKGYTYGSYWNGFSCPYFDLETCKKILDDINERYRNGVAYYVKDDAIHYILANDEEWETLEKSSNGLYALGAYSWTWGEVKEETLKEQGLIA